MDLSDVLNILYHRIKLGHVDDLDYFTFPKKTEQNLKNNPERRAKVFSVITRMIRRFTIMYRLGAVKYPNALVILNKVREDREYLQNLQKKIVHVE